MKRLVVGVALFILVMGPGAWSQEPAPVGDEFQVNSYTTGDERIPSVAADADGGFVAVWLSEGSNGTDSSSTSIQGQRYHATGSPDGGEFQINTYTTGEQTRPVVGMNANGVFVVLWQSYGSGGSDTSSSSVQGQRYDATGTPIGGEFQVNTYTTGYQVSPAVAMNSAGDFVVVWRGFGSYGSDTDPSAILGQRYDATGTPIGGEFQVNTYTTSRQFTGGVAMNSDRDFVVVWSSRGSSDTDQDETSIQGQRYDATGTPIGGEFQVNTYTTNSQSGSDVAVGSSGEFVVVWWSYGSNGNDDSYNSIQGQRYDATGLPAGNEFQINTYTSSQQGAPAVTMNSDGNFVVVWDSGYYYGPDGSNSSIQGQLYDATGTPIEGEFQVNSYTTSYQYFPAVAPDSNGNFVVVWESMGSSGSDTDSWSIQGQRFTIPIFADGFESGDTSSWSSAVQ